MRDFTESELEAVHHRVQGGGELAKFIVGKRNGNALGDVERTDGAGIIGDGDHRLKRAASHPVAGGARHQEDEGNGGNENPTETLNQFR